MAESDSDNGGSAKSYHEALGQFIEAFASTEQFLHMLLCHYAKISPGVGRAVFQATRTRQAIDLIKDIVSVNDPGEPRKSDLDVVFKQLGAINEARNSIVHSIPLSGIPGDVRHLTNVRALTKKHRPDIPVSVSTLAEMTDDLQKIQTHIWYHLCFDRVPNSIMAMFNKVRSLAIQGSSPDQRNEELPERKADRRWQKGRKGT